MTSHSKHYEFLISCVRHIKRRQTTGKYWLNFVILTPRYRNKILLLRDAVHLSSLIVWTLSHMFVVYLCIIQKVILIDESKLRDIYELLVAANREPLRCLFYTFARYQSWANDMPQMILDNLVPFQMSIREKRRTYIMLPGPRLRVVVGYVFMLKRALMVFLVVGPYLVQKYLFSQGLKWCALKTSRICTYLIVLFRVYYW